LRSIEGFTGPPVKEVHDVLLSRCEQTRTDYVKRLDAWENILKSVFEGYFAASRPDGTTPEKRKNSLIEKKRISSSAADR
jgi:hypothetical protein